MASHSIPIAHLASPPGPSLYEKLNSQWHEHALQGFLLVVLAHWEVSIWPRRGRSS
jgi:hypothetical protein